LRLRLAWVVVAVALTACGGGTTLGGSPTGGGSGVAPTAAPTAKATTAPGGQPTASATATATPAGTATVTPTTAPTATPTGSASAFSLSKIKHVFIVMLENESYSTTFASTPPAPYLAQTLPAQGALLEDYYGVGHASLDNYIALISGQAPSYFTQTDCQDYLNFIETTTIIDGQAQGAGCVFPTTVPNITDNLDTKGVTWRSYDEDMGNDPTRESATCGHPTLNDQDMTQDATASDQYATRHNPFMYFHSIIDNPICNTNVLNFHHVATDLSSIATTANYNFFTPNLCDDGHDSPCATGQAGGLPQINTFLLSFIPQILASPAYKQDGLLIITFDEAAESDGSSCCGELPGPNSANPGLVGLGGGVIGAVLLSRYIKPGTVSMLPYNHYATLRTIEDIFGVPYLGYSQASGLTDYSTDIFTNPGG
jgi:hypothetical protein